MKLLCFGDSNTYGYDPSSYLGGRYDAESRWVDVLAQRSGWKVVNAGENGREIPKREEELLRFKQLLSDVQPLDLVLIMLGSNDLMQGADAAEAADRMEVFLTQVPFSREKTILIAPPPMQPGAWITQERLLEDSRQLASMYQVLAERLGIHYVDAGHWAIDLTFDGVHFSEEGHKVFAEMLYLMLKK